MFELQGKIGGPDGTTLTITMVQKFGTGIVEPAAPLRAGPATASGGGTSALRSLFNFN